ncbi:hypothetical protein QBC47DRAFT_304211 [Echria macrotheca]|uniref:SET domain-containing protein n=1 Tax=Echria macrotheca TaxID=438768 RepID=A0AAJ0F9D8_9PEZI|nr:hypothetical protein QBC47DRAFT_304211 [Echria macrotheca]
MVSSNHCTLLRVLVAAAFFISSQSLVVCYSTTTSSWSSRDPPFPRKLLTTNTCPSSPSLPAPSLPWSHAPFCPPPSNPNIGGEVPDDCVFIVTTFRASQGLSLVTTPDLASSIVSFLDDGFVSVRLRDHPSVSQRQQDTSTEKHDGRNGMGYTVKPLPGRGKGVLATRRFAKHETVMVDFPALLVRFDFLNSERFDPSAQRGMLERAVRRLPRETRDAIIGTDVVRDVIQTNAFGVEIEGVNHMALFLHGSRVNHGCRPNVFWRYSHRDMAMEMVALREIKPGDEIVHSYAPLGYTMQERQQTLEAWGFRCRCEMCSAPAGQIALSDRRRERMFEIHSTLGMAAESASLSKQRIDALVREAMGIIEVEELDPQLVAYHEVFARAYMSVGDVSSARSHVMAAEEKWVYYEGEEHSNIEQIKRLWEELDGLQEEVDEDDDDED